MPCSVTFAGTSKPSCGSVRVLASNTWSSRSKIFHSPKLSVPENSLMSPPDQRPLSEIRVVPEKTSFVGDEADFSGLADNADLLISQIVHQAMIVVDEAGSEAAAATAVVVSTTSVAAPDSDLTTFIADHPFVVLIQDRSTGEIVFVGTVADPSVL